MWNREPALIIGALQALLAVGIGFGLDLSEEQLALILAATAAVLALLTRSQVTPTGKPGRRHDTPIQDAPPF